jgi:hypothetical protein
MILSSFISLVLCFKGIILVAGAKLLTVRNWATWSDRPFIMGHVEDELSFVISTNILSTAVLELFFQVLIAKCTV